MNNNLKNIFFLLKNIWESVQWNKNLPLDIWCPKLRWNSIDVGGFLHNHNRVDRSTFDAHLQYLLLVYSPKIN